MRSLLQAGSTSFVVTLGVMPSLLKPFCKAGHVWVFKVGMITLGLRINSGLLNSLECLVVSFSAQICA